MRSPDAEEPQRKPITERQAQARRENGTKSKGPVSDDGKARSRLNAVRHGGYSRVPAAITVGPFAEDPYDIEAFVASMVEAMDPPDDFAARYFLEAAILSLLKEERVVRYEAELLGEPLESHQATEEEVFFRERARLHRAAAQDVHRFGDGETLTHDELLNILSVLGFHPRIREEAWCDIPDDASNEVFAESLRDLLERRFDSIDDAAQLALDSARESMERAEAGNERIRATAVRDLLKSDVLARLDRAGAHASRESERKMQRYRLRVQELSEMAAQSAPLDDTA